MEGQLPEDTYARSHSMSALGIHPTSVYFDGHELRFECDALGTEFEEIARRELRECPEVASAALEEFRRLLRAEKGLHVRLEDDWFLYPFLRPCKFYPESALQRARNFFTFKLDNPQICESLLPSALASVLRENLLTVLPRRDRWGRRLLVLRCGRKWNTRRVSTNDLMRAVMLMLQAAMLEPRTQVCGVALIWDLEGMGMDHVLQLSPKFASMLLHWVQECIPLRVKGLHVVNQNLFFKLAFAVIKPFMGRKLRSRLVLHGYHRDALRTDLGSEALPCRYGGDLDLDLDGESGEKLCSVFENFEHVFQETNKYGYVKS